MKPLIILRPEPGASRTAARAEALGLQVQVIPLFAIVPVEWTAPDPSAFDGLILTSANAVRHGGEELHKLKSLPVHAVGEATAELARAAGFTIASIGKGGSREMEIPKGQRLLHLTGRDHVEIGADTAIAVYEARPFEQQRLRDIRDCVVAVHSPRAGQRLAELAEQRPTIAVAAISPAAAAACGSGWHSVDWASEPNDAALLALAARLCESRDA